MGWQVADEPSEELTRSELPVGSPRSVWVPGILAPVLRNPDDMRQFEKEMCWVGMTVQTDWATPRPHGTIIPAMVL